MSNKAEGTVTTHDDGRWIRTAIVVPKEGVSFDLVNELGERIALINAFVYHDEVTEELTHTIIDVIDKDEKFSNKHAMWFDEGVRGAQEVSYLVCADFRK